MKLLLCIGALLLMVGLMYYSVTYSYPTAKPLDVSGFVALWFKEILILGLLVLGLLVGTVAWLIKLIGLMLARGKNAL
ncbi:hypothetical protein ASC87_26055 [Rhizobacter sp. Root1221]|nr:hypothetical protein ASC87_26055 [Rhizobacter sp. Root1221]